MVNVNDSFPDPEQLLTLPTEDVAAGLLQIHAPSQQRDPTYSFQPQSDVGSLYSGDPLIVGNRRRQLQRVIVEGFTGLEGNALIARDPVESPGRMFVTRRGLAAASNFPSFRQAKGLDRELLPQATRPPRRAAPPRGTPV